MEAIKDLLTLSRNYKATVFKRLDGFFTIEFYRWDDEYEYWTPVTTTASIIDSYSRAVHNAIGRLQDLSHEMVEDPNEDNNEGENSMS